MSAVETYPNFTPRIGLWVVYVTDGRNGLSYPLPAMINCTQDTHPGDYPCEECGGLGGVSTGIEHMGQREEAMCETCEGSGIGANNPMPVPSSPWHVHLTVLTPGGKGTTLLKEDGTLWHPVDDKEYVGAKELNPGSGTYAQLNVPHDREGNPGTWFIDDGVRDLATLARRL